MWKTATLEPISGQCSQPPKSPENECHALFFAIASSFGSFILRNGIYRINRIDESALGNVNRVSLSYLMKKTLITYNWNFQIIFEMEILAATWNVKELLGIVDLSYKLRKWLIN